MTRWWSKTHGPFFELTRRFFDSEIVTHPGPMLPVLIGILPSSG